MQPAIVRALVILVLANAAAGIVALLAGDRDFDESEGRVLATTICLSAAGLVGLPAFVALSSNRPAVWRLTALPRSL